MADTDPITLDAAVRLHQSGQIDAAAEAYRAILRRNPDDPNALHLLGVAALQSGDAAVAAEHIGRAIAIQPNTAVFHQNHASALRSLGRIDDAIAQAELAIALDPPRGAGAYQIAGLAFSDDGQVDDAIFCWQKAVELDPALVEAHLLLGRALRERGRFEDAVRSLRSAAVRLADVPGIQFELGAALRRAKELEAAVAAFDAALRLDPRLHEALVERGFTLAEMDRYTESMADFRAAIAIRPDAQAHVGLGLAHSRRAEIDESIEEYRNAVRLDPDDARAHSTLLMTLHYSPHVRDAAMFAEHAEWNRRHAAPLTAQAAPHGHLDRDPDRPLRVGFVSADFRGHPVSRFIEPVLIHGDRGRFTFACYSVAKRHDEMSDRLRGFAGEWHDCATLDDEQLARRIRDDRIDVLVDLAGHTARNRLLAFARRPAPVQCTQFGYPDTTGMTAMDYRMTDALTDPPGANDAYHSETLARLPHVAWCYAPRVEATPVVLRDGVPGPVTFGVMNNITKVTAAMTRVFQRVLEATPGSRLIVLGTHFDEIGAITEVLRRRGLDVSRAAVVPSQPTREYHELFGLIDVALDPFPYNGGVSTCDALWMGVPVVSLAGGRYVSRQGLALLTQVGLADLVATTEDQYVRTAAALGANRDRRATLRRTLRPTMAASPICDGRAFTGALQDFYRSAWRAWCRGAPGGA